MYVYDKPKKTSVGIELIRRLVQEGHRIFTITQARQYAPTVGMNPSYLLEALYHLKRNGWIVQLRRGLYAIATGMPGILPIREYEIAMQLLQPSAISHWSALHHHGLTDQIPRKIFVLSPRRFSTQRNKLRQESQDPTDYLINGVLFHFIHVKDEKYFGIETTWAGDVKVNVTDPERTLLDGLSLPWHCGDFSEVLHAFETRSARLDLEKIINYALRLDFVTAKRLGWVLERRGVALERLKPLLTRPLTGYLMLDPSGSHAGPYNRRWMLRENLPGRNIR
jgi:predicted transcriptional regulator of viral defense system